MEILVKENWNWNTCLIKIEIETEIHCKTIIETELKYIINNGIEIETEIYLITDTTLMHPASPVPRYRCPPALPTVKWVMAVFVWLF